MKNLAVFFGGKSTEHDVSIITALQIINILNSVDEYNVYPIYFNHSNEMFLGKHSGDLSINDFGQHFNKKRFQKVALISGDNSLYDMNKGRCKKICPLDVGVNCCHGGMGENGSLAGLIDMCNFPIICGDNASMALCMDKKLSKMICACNNINIVPYKVINLCDYQRSGELLLGELTKYPYIVKPSNLGSSIGVSYVENKAELIKALELVYQFDDCALVEAKVQNLHEYNCSVIGSARINEVKVSNVEEPIIKNTYLTFDDKYVSNSKTKNTKINFGQKRGMENLSRRYPADISDDLRIKIQDCSKKVFEVFNLSGVCRIDYLYDAVSEELYVNEINTVPGSLAYYFWVKDFDGERDFMRYIIDIAQQEFMFKKSKKFTYFSSILNNL